MKEPIKDLRYDSLIEVEKMLREYRAEMRLADPEDLKVSEDTLIENALKVLAEIEWPAEERERLRQLFEELRSDLSLTEGSEGSPLSRLILTPIIDELKNAIVNLQGYFRTTRHYNARRFIPETAYIEAVIDQFIMSDMYYFCDPTERLG
jgi:hypothetical protein